MSHKARAAWNIIKGDGCTGAPDMTFGPCCLRHDRHYTTHHHASGRPITRAQADALFLACLRKNPPPIPIIGALFPWLYWSAVRVFGGRYWRKFPKPE